jgi:hypothetical protein
MFRSWTKAECGADLCDDLNDCMTGIHGDARHPQSITPNVDKLAQSGVAFRRAFSNTTDQPAPLRPRWNQLAANERASFSTTCSTVVLDSVNSHAVSDA